MNRKILIGVFALCLLSSGTLARAGSGAVTMSFVMPQGVDPDEFDFTQSGQTIDIPGSAFLPMIDGGDGGADFYAKPNGGPVFNGFRLVFTYPGSVTINTSVGLFPTYTPWLSTQPTASEDDLDAQAGSASVGQEDPLNPGHYFFSDSLVTNIDPGDIRAFADSTVHVTAFGPAFVPEPGVVGFAASASLAAIGVFAGRRRRRAM